MTAAIRLKNDGVKGLVEKKYAYAVITDIVHQLRAENLGLWLTRGEQPKHVTY